MLSTIASVETEDRRGFRGRLGIMQAYTKLLAVRSLTQISGTKCDDFRLLLPANFGIQFSAGYGGVRMSRLFLGA